MFARTKLVEAGETVIDCVTCKVRHGSEIEGDRYKVFVGSSTLNDVFPEDYYTFTTVTRYFFTASTVTSYC